MSLSFGVQLLERSEDIELDFIQLCSDSDSSPELSEAEEQRISIDESCRKRKRVCEAFQYKSRFKNEWKKQWPFISSVSGSPYCFRCNVCNKELSCSHQGVKDIKDHIATQKHQQLAKSLPTQQRLNFMSAADPLQDKVSTSIIVL